MANDTYYTLMRLGRNVDDIFAITCEIDEIEAASGRMPSTKPGLISECSTTPSHYTIDTHLRQYTCIIVTDLIA